MLSSTEPAARRFPRTSSDLGCLSSGSGVNYVALPGPSFRPMKDAPSPSKQPPPGTEYEVPVEGSLALLALGARGIEAWRAKRAEAEKNAPRPSVPVPDAPDAPSDD